MNQTTVDVGLFGAFRAYQSPAIVSLCVPRDACIADVRTALADYGRIHWPQFSETLLRASAFASDTALLNESDAIPCGILAVLPPVAGG